jgi:hypothetical protein
LDYRLSSFLSGCCSVVLSFLLSLWVWSPSSLMFSVKTNKH